MSFQTTFSVSNPLTMPFFFLFYTYNTQLYRVTARNLFNLSISKYFSLYNYICSYAGVELYL